jgi:hypothetical protein
VVSHPIKEKKRPFKAMFGGSSAPAMVDRNLSLDRVREFLMQTRRGSLIAFKNVSLRPAHRTQVVIVAPAQAGEAKQMNNQE